MRELIGKIVGLRERDSVLMCTLCTETIILAHNETERLVGYLTRVGEDWEISGIYCNQCEVDGGEMNMPTEGVDEAIVLLDIEHVPGQGTLIRDIEVLERNQA